MSPSSMGLAIDNLISYAQSTGAKCEVIDSLMYVKLSCNIGDNQINMKFSFQVLEQMGPNWVINEFWSKVDKNYGKDWIKYQKIAAEAKSSQINKFMQNLIATGDHPKYTTAQAHEDAFKKAVAFLEEEKQKKAIAAAEKNLLAAQKQAKYTQQYGAGSQSNADYADGIARLIPAIKTTEAECPAQLCTVYNYIWSVVQHINDTHRWNREAIADWLDTLHDSGVINLVLTNPNEDRG